MRKAPSIRKIYFRAREHMCAIKNKKKKNGKTYFSRAVFIFGFVQIHCVLRLLLIYVVVLNLI